jgi:hypothetical protein
VECSRALSSGSLGIPVRHNREGPVGVTSGQAVEKHQLLYCEERFSQACPSMIKAGAAIYNSLFCLNARLLRYARKDGKKTFSTACTGLTPFLQSKICLYPRSITTVSPIGDLQQRCKHSSIRSCGVGDFYKPGRNCP